MNDQYIDVFLDKHSVCYTSIRRAYIGAARNTIDSHVEFPHAIISPIDRLCISWPCAWFCTWIWQQVIVGEHKEPAEVELTEGSMAWDTDVESILESGNMEQLAALVLNGEGRRLVGRQTGNPELQAFIDNVPAYMVCHYYMIQKVEQTYLRICVYIYMYTCVYKIYCFVILGKNPCCTHSSARGKSSRSAKRTGSAQIRSSTRWIVAPWCDTITRGRYLRKYRYYQVFN